MTDDEISKGFVSNIKNNIDSLDRLVTVISTGTLSLSLSLFQGGHSYFFWVYFSISCFSLSMLFMILSYYMGIIDNRINLNNYVEKKDLEKNKYTKYCERLNYAYPFLSLLSIISIFIFMVANMSDSKKNNGKTVINDGYSAHELITLSQKKTNDNNHQKILNEDVSNKDTNIIIHPNKDTDVIININK